MPRPIWNGSISFGLVQIPVGLYPAEKQDELSLTMLDRHDMAPVGYERVNKRTGRKVEWKDVVRGYPYRKGEYVVVTDADLREANVEATQTIDIVAFVDPSAIDPTYYERPYYLAPRKQGMKAYAVLRETLRESGLVAVAKVVIRTRQHLAAVEVQDDRLVLELLRFAHELRSPDDLELPDKSLKKLGVTSRELSMAKQLVSGMVEPWNPSQYKDEYRDDLLARIEKKAEAGEINVAPDAKASKAPPAPRAQVIDLLDLLKKSIDKKPGPRKAHAPHRGAAGSRARSSTGHGGRRKGAVRRSA